MWLTSGDQEKAPTVPRPQHKGDANSETINELTDELTPSEEFHYHRLLQATQL